MGTPLAVSKFYKALQQAERDLAARGTLGPLPAPPRESGGRPGPGAAFAATVPPVPSGTSAHQQEQGEQVEDDGEERVRRRRLADDLDVVLAQQRRQAVVLERHRDLRGVGRTVRQRPGHGAVRVDRGGLDLVRRHLPEELRVRQLRGLRPADGQETVMKQVREGIETAQFLGAPVARLFAGNVKPAAASVLILSRSASP